jgi:hypothetical protein
VFCRHGRREDRCVVCSNEKRKKAAKANVGSGRITSARTGGGTRSASRSAASGALTARRKTAAKGGVRVKQATRHAGDGWSSELLPGLRSSREAEDLLTQVSRAHARLQRLSSDPPGPYATVKALAGGDEQDREHATWLLFQIAYYGPLEGEQPFAEIERLLVRWDDPLPDAEALREANVGPRGAHAHDRGDATLRGYREWASRAGGQLRGLSGHGTDPARRFDAAYRALALPGLTRPARYEFVVTLGVFGLLDVAPWSLLLDSGRSGAAGARDLLSVAAKRAFLTGDSVLLQRRFGAFVRELGVPVAACDLGFLNWELRPSPTAPLGYLEAGVPVDPDPAEVARFARTVGLPTDDADEIVDVDVDADLDGAGVDSADGDDAAGDGDAVDVVAAEAGPAGAGDTAA